MESGTPLKRKRTENWLNEDKVLLQDLIRTRVHKIENKNTDTNTNKTKKAAWEDVLNSFNSMCKGIQRTVPQLKTQWGMLKMQCKKENAEIRKEIIMTGGGPPNNKSTAVAGDDIRSWLPNEFVVDINEFDSDKFNSQVIHEISESMGDTVEANVHTEEACIRNTTNKVPVLDVEASSSYSQENIEQTPNLEKLQAKDENIIRNNMPTTSSCSDEKKKRKKPFTNLTNAADAIRAIASNEIEGTSILNDVKLENERKRGKNLNLKYEVLKQKLEYYKSLTKNDTTA